MNNCTPTDALLAAVRNMLQARFSLKQIAVSMGISIREAGHAAHWQSRTGKGCSIKTSLGGIMEAVSITVAGGGSWGTALACGYGI